MLVIVVLKLSNSIIVFLIFDELFMALDNDEFLINIKTFSLSFLEVWSMLVKLAEELISF